MLITKLSEIDKQYTAYEYAVNCLVLFFRSQLNIQKEFISPKYFTELRKIYSVLFPLWQVDYRNIGTTITKYYLS